ncbi:hypothetical protein AVEN_234125-1 [Araneus ventricosus]|uniref:Uncharacterized protein n=1 Tax=Araneus ventricosus TaxID=182803 RepID=A0A4Y2GL27_ARAVE|nr:hypothetical protein AVEN_234125-1 [Araneus ventricosus]
MCAATVCVQTPILRSGKKLHAFSNSYLLCAGILWKGLNGHGIYKAQRDRDYHFDIFVIIRVLFRFNRNEWQQHKEFGDPVLRDSPSPVFRTKIEAEFQGLSPVTIEKIEENVQSVKREIGEVKGEVERKIEEVEDKEEGKIEEVEEKVQVKIGDPEKRLSELEDRQINFPANPELTYSRPTVKSLTFDGQTFWTVFKTQFDVVSSANGWNNRVKASQLVASLRGSAAEVL